MADQRPILPAEAVDQTRDACIEMIQQQYALGALSQEDLDDRVGLALLAKTPGALSALTADLPPLPMVQPESASTTRPTPEPARPGRRRTYAIVGAVAAVVVGLGGIVAVGGVQASAGQQSHSFYCESTGSEDPAQLCPAMSADRLRLESYVNQIESYRYQLEDYNPSKELLARAESSYQLATMARERARIEAVVEAAGGKPDTAAIAELTAQLETAMRDAAAVLAEGIANGPR